MDRVDLNTAFNNDGDSLPPTPDVPENPSQGSTQENESQTSVPTADAETAEEDNSYFDSSFHASLAIEPAENFEPSNDIVGEAERAPSSQEATSAPPPPPPPAEQNVLVVDDKDSDEVQFIDLTKEGEEVLVLESSRPSTRPRRTSRKLTTLPDADTDCPVVIEEVRPADMTARQRRSNRQLIHSLRHTMSAPSHDMTIVLDDDSTPVRTSQSLTEPPSAPQTSSSFRVPYVGAPSEEPGLDDLVPNKRTRYDNPVNEMLALRRINAIADHLRHSLNPQTSLYGGSAMPTTSAMAYTQAAAMLPPPPFLMPPPASAPKPVTNEKPKSELQCPICLETLDELKEHNKNLMATLCGHVLCNTCLDEHFKASSKAKTFTCPTCRGKLTKAKIHNLYL